MVCIFKKEKSTAQPKGGTAMLVCLLQGDLKLLSLLAPVIHILSPHSRLNWLGM